MGAIQGALNSITGSVAGVAVGAKKLSEASAKEAEAKKQEEINLTAEIPSLKEEIAKGGEELQAKQKEQAKIESGRNSQGQFRSKVDVMRDVKAGQLAIRSLEGKQKARAMQLELMQARFREITGGKE